MQLPPVVQPVMTDDAPGRDLLADVGRGDRELGLDLEHQESSPALDPDVVVAVQLVADLSAVAYVTRLFPAAIVSIGIVWYSSGGAGAEFACSIPSARSAAAFQP